MGLVGGELGWGYSVLGVLVGWAKYIFCERSKSLPFHMASIERKTRENIFLSCSNNLFFITSWARFYCSVELFILWRCPVDALLKMKIATSKTYKSIFLSLRKILGGRGNNLHEVETSDGTKFLVSMPSKFRKSVWIKRGMDGGLRTVVFNLCLKPLEKNNDDDFNCLFQATIPDKTVKTTERNVFSFSI